MGRSRNHARCFLVWASLTALVTLGQVLALQDLLSAATALERDVLATQRFDQLLVWLCSGIVVGCGAWWWLASSLVVLDAVRGRTGCRPRGCPAILRRWLLIACGVAVVGSVAAAPSVASPVADPSRPSPDGETQSSLGSDLIQRRAITGLPLPDRVGIAHIVDLRSLAQAGPRVFAPRRSGSRVPERSVTVRLGDSLWVIASREVGRTAHPDAIDKSWRALYELNRHVIGQDPDLIHPGLRLRLPGAGQE